MSKSCCDEPQLMPVADAIAQMRAQTKTLVETESIALSHALDRILAEPVYAKINVPAHANSAMDGYALRAAEASLQQPLQLIGKALAGHAYDGLLEPGTCVRITTGALIPAGADCVVMQENTTHKDNQIQLTQLPHLGENIRLAGEDISCGELVVAQGQRLGPIEIGLLASQGIAQVPVYRRLRVAVISTGDELTAPGQSLPSGHIYDSNRYGIIALLQRLAVEVIDLGLIPDQPDAIRSAFYAGAAQADAIISSGGVSVGDADFVKDLLSETGQVHFWKVAIKPGKPFAFGKLGQSHFFGLPGNPVSAMVTLHQLVLPILQQLAGERHHAPLTLQVVTDSGFKKRPGRSDYQRAQLKSENGQDRVVSNGVQGSGVLTSFTNANCYVVLEQDRASVGAGEKVTVLPFDRFIR